MGEGKAPLEKRKAEVLEDGQVERVPEDVEPGEVVEEDDAALGEEFEEVIQDGRVSKTRRVEDI